MSRAEENHLLLIEYINLSHKGLLFTYFFLNCYCETFQTTRKIVVSHLNIIANIKGQTPPHS